MNRFQRLMIPVALAGVLAGACGSAAGSTAVSVGGTDYSESDLRADLADQTVDGTVDAAVTTDWLNQWIFFTAIELELESRGVAPTDEQIEAAAAELMARDATFDGTASGDELRIRFWALRVAAGEWVENEHPDAPPVDVPAGPPPRMLCSRHILVPSDAEALDVMARIDAGEDFAVLAQELSTDTGSGAAGGDLGCVPEGAFVPEFEAAGYGADDGEVVGPVESQFGFHVIEVLSAGPATVEEHPNADPAVVESIAASAQATVQNEAQSEVLALRDALLADVQAEALVKFADDVTVASEYGTWDAVGFLVLGPEAVPVDAG